MKILWVVNTVFPDLSKALGQNAPVIGGWMYDLAKDLSQLPDINLYVATVYGGQDIIHKNIGEIEYYLVPKKNKHKWGEVYDLCQPAVVHIHGSEFDYGLNLIDCRPQGKYILSIQGLVSEIYKYYLGGLTNYEVISSITLRDIIKRDTLFQGKRNFYKRGLQEQAYFKKVNAVMGRTDWDQAHAWALNPKLKYFHCPEQLRDEFYTSDKWSYENCEKHSIFISQAGYPIKGLHQVLKAVALLKSEIPDIKLYVAGYKICEDKTLKDRLRMTGYGAYIKKLIKKLGLQSHVEFVGLLKADEMKAYYLKSNVFVCPSAIENSPNSVCEAQELGVPIISSYVGGIASVIRPSSNVYMYEYNDFILLAFYLRVLFLESSANSMNKSREIISNHENFNLINIIAILNSIYNDLFESKTA